MLSCVHEKEDKKVLLVEENNSKSRAAVSSHNFLLIITHHIALFTGREVGSNKIGGGGFAFLRTFSGTS